MSKLEMNMIDDPLSESEKIYEYITDAVIMRSKSQWYEEGEKPAKNFCLWRKGIKLNHTLGKCF